MKTLKFKSNLVAGVLNGERKTTWRLFDDKSLTVGDQLSLVDAASGKEFATAEILNINEKKLNEVVTADFDNKHWQTDVEGMVKHFREIYGDKVIPSSAVKIITFKLLK